MVCQHHMLTLKCPINELVAECIDFFYKATSGVFLSVSLTENSSIYPFSVPATFHFWVIGVCWSLFQLSRGERRGTPWIGRQPIAVTENQHVKI